MIVGETSQKTSFRLAQVNCQGSIYWGGGGGGKLPPPKKNFSWKKFKAISNKDLIWRLLMSRNGISANPEHYIFQIFWGSMPPDPHRRPKHIFLAAASLKNFFKNRLSPQTKNPR